MDSTIDKLQIIIESESSEAANGIDRLLQSLGKIKELNSGEFSGLQRISDAFNNLKNTLNAANRISQNIGDLKSAFDKFSDINTVGLRGFVKEFKELEGLSDMSLFATSVGTVTNALTKMEKIDVDGITTQIQNLVNAIKPLTDEMIRGGERIGNYGDQLLAFVSAAKKATSAQASFARTEKMSKSGTGGIGGLFSSLGKIKNSAIFAFVATGIRSISKVIANSSKSMIDYIEVMDLFNVSLKGFAGEASEFIGDMEAKLGVNATEASKTIGTFMSLANSFGIAGEQAYLMSKNLTQLAYDYSSAYNISVESAFEKLRSGFVGEIEPMRALGKDLSVARLQQELYNMGINAQVENLTQADKATLRYIVTMKQSGDQMNNLARTIESPANMLRILKAQFESLSRTIGSLFIPVLSAILPYVIAVVRVLTQMAQGLAAFFGIEMPEVGGFKAVEENVTGIGDAAAEAKKEVLTLIGGFDELNKIQVPNEGAGEAAIGSALGDLTLPEYDIFKELADNKIDEIVKKMKEWLGINKEIDTWAEFFETRLGKIFNTVVGIGTALAAWKIAQSVLGFLDKLQNMKTFGSGLGFVGLIGLISDIKKFVEYFDDFLINGPTLENVSGMIAEFAGAIGDSLIMLGGYKTGGALKVVQGVGEIVSAIADMTENGVNWDNVDTVIRGITNVGIGIGVMTGNLKLVGWSLAFQGLSEAINAVRDSWEAIKAGDWSNVEWADLAIGVIKALGGIVIAVGGFSKIKEITGLGSAKKSFETVADVTGELSTTTSTKLSPSLSSLAKNLGLGLVIIAEVAAAAILIAGAIIVLGKELEQVGIAWQPVIDNGTTIAIAMGLGVGVLAAIGTVTALLGSAGTTLVTHLGLGIAVLAELGIATLLFVAEIWAIGKALDEVGQAWQPVLDNGETIAAGIALGTTLLVGIGVVTAALGAATVASAGTLPIAIGLGTALLVELSAAFVLFTEGLVAVADELSERLSPSLENLNDKLPGVSSNMESFVGFMTEFADHVVEYTKVSSIAGLSAMIDTIIDFFLEDPIEKFAGEVQKIHDDVVELNAKLDIAIPELKRAVEMMSDFQTLIEELDALIDMDVSLDADVRLNMNQVGQNIILGLTDGMKAQSIKLQTELTRIKENFLQTWSDITSETKEFFEEFDATVDQSMKLSYQNMEQGMRNISRLSQDTFRDLRTTTKSFISGFRSDWTSGWSSIQSSASSAFSSIRSSASSAFSSVSSAASSMISKIKSAISSIKDLMSWKDDLDDMDFGGESSGGLTGIAGLRARGTGVTTFATGGVVSEPTYALVGEYTSAKNNPEVIAPQSVIEQSVVNANGDMVSALYDMATMVVAAIENNSVTVEADSDAMFKVVRKKGVDYQRNTGKPVFAP